MQCCSYSPITGALRSGLIPVFLEFIVIDIVFYLKLAVCIKCPIIAKRVNSEGYQHEKEG